MDLETYLRSLNIGEADIQRITDEKIDCTVISLMTDEDLAWFIKSKGDRVLVRDFVKKNLSLEIRKECLMRNVKERLASIRSKRPVCKKGTKRKSPNESGERAPGNHTKSIRQLYLGWKHREGDRFIQVIEKKGGGTKLLSMPKEYTRPEIIDLAKKLYFPKGQSSKGTAGKFLFNLVDSTNKTIAPEKTVLDLLEEKHPKVPRIYITTERLENDVEVVVDNLGNEANDTGAPSTNEYLQELTPRENIEVIEMIEISDDNTPAASVLFKNRDYAIEGVSSDCDYVDNSLDFRTEVNNNCEENLYKELTCLPNIIEPQIELNSASYVSTSDAENDTLVIEPMLPVIEKKDLLFSGKILGAGAQGTVREGTWLGTAIAIKTFKTGKLSPNELREVNLLARIRHPNIIQIMGISLDNRQTHVILEMVKGHNLGDILFDDDVKILYNLDITKKNQITLQICQAISYLHRQTNSIIHQDIKPDNILVNESFVVKLCDLGLAKLKHMATAFRTVLGALKGTLVYMAPEIIMEKDTATTYSDIWSLGCTIVEIYTEDDVWSDLGGDCSTALKKKMITFQTPDLSKLPLSIQPIIQRCFKYNPLERTSIEELLEHFKGL